MVEECGNSTLGVELAAGDEVEQLCHGQCDEPNQSQSDRCQAIIDGVGVQCSVLCIEGQWPTLRTDQLPPLLTFPALAVCDFIGIT
jgi:hypothetical protein